MAITTTAAILVGHGSIHSDSGKSMIRIAARLREQGVAPIVEAGFLNYNQPTVADAIQKCKILGATEVIVQPYFLIDGQYASQDLPNLVHHSVYNLAHAAAPEESTLCVTIAATLGYHPALVKLVTQRVLAVDPDPEPATALLLVAHGTPLPTANAPIVQTARTVGEALGYGIATVAYLDCNTPTIPAAIDQLVLDGYRKLVILPYFLHLGRHVRTDLPNHFATARIRHPQTAIIAAHHLDYDPLLAEVAAARISFNCSRSQK